MKKNEIMGLVSFVRKKRLLAV